MGGPIEQSQITDIGNQIAQAEDTIQQVLKDPRWNSVPSSDSKTSVLDFLKAKLGFLVTLKAKFATGDVTPEDLNGYKETIKKNREWLLAFIRAASGVLVEIVKTAVDVIKALVQVFIDLFEAVKGELKVAMVDDGTYRATGTSSSVLLTPGPRVAALGYAAQTIPGSFGWSATLVYDGTTASGAKRYRISAYAAAVGDVAFGATALQGVAQQLDYERDSFVTVDASGQVAGELHTRFTSATWGDADPGIPAMSEIAGTLTGETASYQNSGEDCLSLALLAPARRLVPIPEPIPLPIPRPAPEAVGAATTGEPTEPK